MSEQIAAPRDHLVKGVGYMLLSAFSFALMGMLSKIVVPVASLGVVLFIAFIICLLLTLPKVWQSRKELFFPPHFLLIIVRGSLGILSFALLFVAIQEIPLVDAYLLNYSSPLLVPIVALLWRKTPIAHRIWPGLIIGFLGVALILRPTTAVFSMGAIFAFGAAITNATIFVAVRTLAKTCKASIVLFYNFLVSALWALPWAVYSYEPFSCRIWVFILCLGVFMFLGAFFTMRALKFGPHTLIAPFNLTANIYAGLISWLVWGNDPDAFTIAGFFGIAIGCVLVILGGRIPHKEST